MSDRPIRIGISTCPNDTFAFAALLDGRVGDLDLQWTLDDVEALNSMLGQRELDVSKVSFHTALHLADDYKLLPVGAALGFGVGPLLLAKDAEHAMRLPAAGDRVLCPGKGTTATLLYRFFCGDGPEPEQIVFSQIMASLKSDHADYGVVIHEGRFTYKAQGLHLALDLGQQWETQTNAPLPLGGIVARRDLGDAMHARLTNAIRQSLMIARLDPASAVPAMSKYAQEFSVEVLMEHVKLYVNESTQDLDADARRAIELLASKAKAIGLIEKDVSLF